MSRRGNPLLHVVDEQGRIYCVKCEGWKSTSAFSVSSAAKRGYQSWCKGCVATYHRTPDRLQRHRDDRRHYKYGLSSEAFDQLVSAQGGRCAIEDCLGPAEHVDHDHACCPGEITCGRCVRAILCRSCNQRLGKADDDVALLRQRGHGALATYVLSCRARAEASVT